MSREDHGTDPAFPTTPSYVDGTNMTQEGMSLRDWFAGMALQGLLVGSSDWSGLIEDAYIIADAMIEQRDT